MPRTAAPSSRKGSTPGMLARVAALIITAIVVLGAFRYLGDGVSMTDPAFWTNAETKISALMKWLSGIARALLP